MKDYLEGKGIPYTEGAVTTSADVQSSARNLLERCDAVGVVGAVFGNIHADGPGGVAVDDDGIVPQDLHGNLPGGGAGEDLQHHVRRNSLSVIAQVKDYLEGKGIPYTEGAVTTSAKIFSTGMASEVPVMLPPGASMLATKPAATGSVTAKLRPEPPGKVRRCLCPH